jgi:hypothetical protein
LAALFDSSDRFTPGQATSPPSEPAEQAAAREDQTQQSGTALPRCSITALQVCVSTVSIVCKRCCSFRDPSKAGLIAVRAIPAGGTDDADGADGIFSARAHPDHSRPQPAFTGERDLDAQCAEERLRPP